MEKKPMTASDMGKKGGKKRMSLLTPEQRKELATKASHSRKIYKDKIEKVEVFVSGKKVPIKVTNEGNVVSNKTPKKQRVITIHYKNNSL